MPNTVSRPVKATTVMKFFPIHFVLVGVGVFNHLLSIRDDMQTPTIIFFFNGVARICDDLFHCTQSDPLNAVSYYIYQILCFR